MKGWTFQRTRIGGELVPRSLDVYRNGVLAGMLLRNDSGWYVKQRTADGWSVSVGGFKGNAEQARKWAVMRFEGKAPTKRNESEAEDRSWVTASATPIQTTIRRRGGITIPQGGTRREWHELLDKRPNIIRKGGLKADEMAEALGFSSDSELYDALAKEIRSGKKATDRRFDDLSDDEIADMERAYRGRGKRRGPKPRGASRVAAAKAPAPATEKRAGVCPCNGKCCGADPRSKCECSCHGANHNPVDRNRRRSGIFRLNEAELLLRAADEAERRARDWSGKLPRVAAQYQARAATLRAQAATVPNPKDYDRNEQRALFAPVDVPGCPVCRKPIKAGQGAQQGLPGMGGPEVHSVCLAKQQAKAGGAVTLFNPVMADGDKKAAALYQRFQGRAAEMVRSMKAPRGVKLPKLVKLGVVPGLVYLAAKSYDGNTTYQHAHKFDSPVLALAHPDGGGFLVLLGKFKVTERGIEG